MNLFKPLRHDDEFAAFVTAASPRLLHLARLITGDNHRAEDLVQQALLGAYRRWASIEGDPFAYVRRSVVNGHASWWSRVGSRELQAERLPEAATGDATDQLVSRAVLRAALRDLTVRERGVVVLRFIEDLSEAQTAHELGIAAGTVKSTSARALAKLRAAVQANEPVRESS